MKFFETFIWYAASTLDYFVQMLPCMLVAAFCYFLLWPLRIKRLTRSGLASRPIREGAMLLFFMYTAGLVSLTFFPAGYWGRVLGALFANTPLTPEEMRIFLPMPEILERISDLPDLIRPLEEIRRAFRGNPWLVFILIGNIAMFVPIGFFSALLWHGGSWMRSTLVGFVFSVCVETFQFFIGRRTDIDDIILNTLGAFFGFLLFFLLTRTRSDVTGHFLCYRREEDLDG